MRTVQNLSRFEARFSRGRSHANSEEYERSRNLQNEAIARLASETGWRAEDIGSLYRWIFHDLEQDARVHDYLFVLTAKQVRRMLNKRRRIGYPD